MTLLLSFREVLPWFFTTDLDIIHQSGQLLLISAMYQIPDALNACAQGLLEARDDKDCQPNLTLSHFTLLVYH